MRVIKFRVWDSLLKKFQECSFSIVRGTPTLMSEQSLQQFTGINDKNGKEIYEGDILKVISEYSFERRKNYLVKFGDYDNQETYENEFSGNGWHLVRLTKTGKESSDIIGIDWDELEVVGNIYENYSRSHGSGKQ